jgi:RHS repeat-associated protein
VKLCDPDVPTYPTLTRETVYGQGWQELQKVDGANTSNPTTTDLLSLQGGLVPRRLASYSSGSASAIRASYYQLDALGSGRAVTGAGGAVQGDFASFSDFGKTLSTTDQPLTPSFTGYEHDAYTGLEYAKNRYYDPQTASFISSDPYPVDPSDLLGMNLYNYVQGNPVNSTDPLGWFRLKAENLGVTEIGDTPNSIANFWGTTWSSIAEINDLSNIPNQVQIKPDWTLVLPHCNFVNAKCQEEIRKLKAVEVGLTPDYGPDCEKEPWECEDPNSPYYKNPWAFYDTVFGYAKYKKGFIPIIYNVFKSGNTDFRNDILNEGIAQTKISIAKKEASYDFLFAIIELFGLGADIIDDLPNYMVQTGDKKRLLWLLERSDYATYLDELKAILLVYKGVETSINAETVISMINLIQQKQAKGIESPWLPIEDKLSMYSDLYIALKAFSNAGAYILVVPDNRVAVSLPTGANYSETVLKSPWETPGRIAICSNSSNARLSFLQHNNNSGCLEFDMGEYSNFFLPDIYEDLQYHQKASVPTAPSLTEIYQRHYR